MERVSIKEAASILGVSEQFIRVGMQRDRLPIGTAVKLSSKWTYYIPRERLMAYMEGRDIKKPPSGNSGGNRHWQVAERT